MFVTTSFPVIVAIHFASFVFTNANTEPVPEPLQKSYDMRNTMKTAYIKYRMGSAGMISNKMQLKNYENRICGDSYLVIKHGDDDGVMWLETDGSPRMGLPNICSPMTELMDSQKGETWTCIEGMNQASIHSKQAPPFDVRTIGLSSMITRESFSEMRTDMTEAFAAMSNFKTVPKGEFIEVTSERKFDQAGPLQNSTILYSWTIDPGKDYAMIGQSATIRQPDGTLKEWEESEIQYQKIDGYWFPSKFSGWYLDIGRNDKKNTSEYELVEASFDRPDHPQKLTIDMLNLPIGALVGRSETMERRIWDGKSSIPEDKWRKIRQAQGRKKTKQVSTDPQKADKYRYPAWWYDNTGNMGIADLETNPDAWEAYVRRWCLKNNADEKQRTEARSVLESSRQQARAILAKRAPDLDKIEVLLKDEKLDPKKADEARTEANGLLAPIGEIFNRLKVRLESLLLQEQLSARKATSAPAAMP